MSRIILDYDSGHFRHQPAHIFEGKVPDEFEIDRLRMASLHGNPDCRRGYGYGIIPENLVGLVDHLHLLLGVAVIEERIDVREYVLVYRIWIYCRIFAPFPSFAFSFHLVYGLVSRPCHGLVGRHDYSFDTVCLVQRGYRHKHLDSGTVRIGYDIVFRRQDIPVDFRHDEFLGRIHPPA